MSAAAKSKKRVQADESGEKNVSEFKHPTTVYSCATCNYASDRTHHYCPSCGLCNNFKLAPDWLAKVYRERPEVFARKQRPKHLLDANGAPLQNAQEPFQFSEQPASQDNDPNDDEPEDASEEDDPEEEVEPEHGHIEVKTMGRTKTAAVKRFGTGDDGLDKVLGGGFPEHNCLMISGAPGAGKSTLMRQTLAALAQAGVRCMLAAGEEATEVIKSEFKRQKLHRKYPLYKDIIMVSSSDPDAIAAAAIEHDIEYLVVDSVHVMKSRRTNGPPGKDRQLNYATALFMNLAHATDEFHDQLPMSIWLVNHMTKGGDMAGSNTAKHETDGAFSLDHIDPITLRPVDDQNEPTGYIRLKVHGKYRRGVNTLKAYYKMTSRGLTLWVPKNSPSRAVKKGARLPKGK